MLPNFHLPRYLIFDKYRDYFFRLDQLIYPGLHRFLSLIRLIFSTFKNNLFGLNRLFIPLIFPRLIRRTYLDIRLLLCFNSILTHLRFWVFIGGLCFLELCLVGLCFLELCLIQLTTLLIKSVTSMSLTFIFWSFWIVA